MGMLLLEHCMGLLRNYCGGERILPSLYTEEGNLGVCVREISFLVVSVLLYEATETYVLLCFVPSYELQSEHEPAYFPGTAVRLREVRLTVLPTCCLLRVWCTWARHERALFVRAEQVTE